MLKKLYEAVFKTLRKNANARAVAKHLARVWLFELKGEDAIYPDMKEPLRLLKRKMKIKGRPIVIVDVGRTAKRQNETFSKGRTKPGSIVTNAEGLESYHQYGLAFDVKFSMYGYRPPKFDWWIDLGNEGKKLGLIWGGDFKDWGHFEWHPGFDWKQLKEYFNN